MSGSLFPALVPERRRGIEILDQPGVDPALVQRSLADVARANALFGGTRSVIAELRPALSGLGTGAVTMLDIGTGMGDIPARARRVARAQGVTLHTVGLDESETLAARARSAAMPTMRGDALALPLRNDSVDIATCSQVLHHFPREQCLVLLREMDRVARHRVIVSDLQRSWFAAAGIWIASFPLMFHPVSRHDGVVSVLRGFRRAELEEMVHAAVGKVPTIHTRPLFRICASWVPSSSA